MAEYTIDKFSYGGNTYNFEKNVYWVNIDTESALDTNQQQDIINAYKEGKLIIGVVQDEGEEYGDVNYYSLQYLGYDYSESYFYISFASLIYNDYEGMQWGTTYTYDTEEEQWHETTTTFPDDNLVILDYTNGTPQYLFNRITQVLSSGLSVCLIDSSESDRLIYAWYTRSVSEGQYQKTYYFSSVFGNSIRIYKISQTTSSQYQKTTETVYIPSITLNGSLNNTSPSFYAPTSAGTSGYYLKSNGSGAPTWAAIPSGAVSDVQINGTSILSSGTANIITNTAYNASTNKVATMTDINNAMTVVTFTPNQTTNNLIISVQQPSSIQNGNEVSY